MSKKNTAKKMIVFISVSLDISLKPSLMSSISLSVRGRPIIKKYVFLFLCSFFVFLIFIQLFLKFVLFLHVILHRLRAVDAPCFPLVCAHFLWKETRWLSCFFHLFFISLFSISVCFILTPRAVFFPYFLKVSFFLFLPVDLRPFLFLPIVYMLDFKFCVVL